MLERQAEAVTETERALRESRVRLRSVVGHAPIVLYALDRDGVVTLSEGKALEAMGLKPGQLVGESVFELYADRQDICDSIRRALSGELFTVKTEVGDLCFETRYTPLLNKQGEPDGCIGVAMDVTQRQRTETALRASEERFRMLVDNIPGVVYLCQNDERYTMLFLNDAVERLTGYEKEAFLEDRISFVDLFHPDDAAGIAPPVDEALALRRPFHLEYRLKHREGHWVWVEETGVGVFRNNELAFLEGYLSDITERKKAEQAIQEAHDRLEARVEERTQELSRANRGLSIEITKHEETSRDLRHERDLLQALMDHMPDYVFVKDRESRFIAANAAQLRNLGAPKLSEVLGKTDRDFSDAELADGYIADDRQVLESGEALINIEEETVSADRSRQKLLTTKVPLRNEQGEVTGLVGIARDVTELQAAQEEAAQTQHTLAHVLRVATVSEMASGLAHELNNPLSAITNFIRGCERRMDTADLNESELRSILSQIKQQADRASGIVKTIRRHVNPRDVQRERCQINDVIREAVGLVATDLRQHQTEIQLNLDESLPPTELNRVQIEQVMLNLLLNAIEAMAGADSAKRRITITTATVERSEQMGQTEQAGPAVEAVQVTVADTGPGIDGDQAAGSFEPFVTTKPDGLGMGLSISRSIIESHGGRLVVLPTGASSSATAGAVLRFHLPALGAAP